MATALELGPEGWKPYRMTGVLLFVLGLLALGPWGWKALEYALADPIERAQMDTERKLAEFGRSHKTNGICQWLVEYHGEAPSSEVLYTTADWSLDHPAGFAAILNGFTEDEFARFCPEFGFAVADSGRADAFRHSFRNPQSKRIRAVLHVIPALVPWSPPQATASPAPPEPPQMIQRSLP